MSPKEAAVLLLALALLLPFATKALTIDDPLFVWVAERIHHAPSDPFGFEVNWYVDPQPMHRVMQNPPLASYWLAAAGLVSWNETWLHLAMAVWPLLALAGTMRLARGLGAEPVSAGLLTLGSAAFLVGATSVMSDVMLLALIVWSVVLWLEGTETRRGGRLVAAALLAAAAALTKYFGIALVPLLFAHTWIRDRRGLRSTWLLALPVAALVGWELYTRQRYGAGHVLGAAAYAGEHGAGRELLGPARWYATMTFLGGSTVWPLVVSLWRGRWGARAAIAAGLVAGGLLLPSPRGVAVDGGVVVSAGSRLLGAVFFAGAVAVAVLVWDRARFRHREPPVRLLVLWIAGTLLFVAVLNWSVAARNVLPLVPPLAVLAACPAGGVRSRNRGALGLAAGVGLVVALTATWSDAAWAGAVRERARGLAGKYVAPGRSVYFCGHWGFQHYMERAGAVALNQKRQPLAPGDVIVLPLNNYRVPVGRLRSLPQLERVEETAVAVPSLVDVSGGVCFYSHALGPLPMGIPSGPPDVYLVLGTG